jgi:hypothetical protein
MLKAPGVHLRPPWLCMARSLLAREGLPHPHSNHIYYTRHGTALSLRNTHSVVDPPESTTKNPDRGSSNDQSTGRDIYDSPLPLETFILIKQKLPELLPEHSPYDAIFEDEGQEYLTVASALSPLNSPHSSIDALTQLIELNDFHRAYSLLKEIQDLNIRIPPSFAYEIPAQAVLRNEVVHSVMAEQFTAWISLIPSATDNNVRRLNETCYLIFDAKVTNIALIFTFAKIMASKGYGQMISTKAIEIIMRYSSFEDGQNFLDEFNEANAQYWNAHDPEIAKKQSEMFANSVRGLALRTLVLSDRVDDALSLLPDLEDTQIRLTIDTYKVLLRRLKMSKDVVHRQHIPVVEKLWNRESIENDSVNPLTVLDDEAAMASKLNSVSPVELTGNLVEDLRYMKLAFIHQVPHPFTIVNFMNAYLSTGRTRALELLFKRAARTSYRVLFTFIFAEMLFYNRLRQYDLVIETFVDHFYLTGVPRERVLNRYNRLSAKRRAFVPNTGRYPPPERCFKFNSSKAAPVGKLWPLSSHCNILYHALVALTPPGPGIEILYQELLQTIEYGKDASTTPTIASVEPLVDKNFRGKPSSGAFTPFFRRLMRVYGAARGAKILNDMIKCGIKPTIHQYTELAGFYAAKGESKKAFLILDHLEGRFESTSVAPAPDPVMYISLMRGFIMSKNLSAATSVRDRLKRCYNYTIGEDSYLDEVLREIDFMEAEQRQPVRFLF